jgi:uncharacterized membrane protein YkoI
MRKITLVAVTLAVCTAPLTATACGSSGSAETDGQRANLRGKDVSAGPSGGSDEMRRGASGGRLGQALRALRTAERSVRRGSAYDIEHDRLSGGRVWEIEVARGTARPYEIDVRADGRKVVRRRRASQVSDDVRKDARATVSLDEALRTAGRRAAGGRFDEAEIDRWHGTLAWEATFKRPGGREVEVRIDARSGRVLAVTTDD